MNKKAIREYFLIAAAVVACIAMLIAAAYAKRAINTWMLAPSIEQLEKNPD